ncbi:MAG: type II secretion system F family protein, partial [Clostridium sp.]
MANFKYVAVNSNNVSIQGAMESHSRQEVVNSLRERGYYPIEITEESALNKDVELSFLNRVTLKDLSMFCRQFGFAMQAGTPMLRALELSITQSDNKALKDILKRVREQVQKGRLLSDALKYEDKIPPLMVSMIAAGEASGKLDYVMMELSEYYKKLYKQKQKVSSATMYPKVVLAFA